MRKDSVRSLQEPLDHDGGRRDSDDPDGRDCKEESPQDRPDVLAGIAGIVTPDTILRWYRTLEAKKYDGLEGTTPWSLELEPRT